MLANLSLLCKNTPESCKIEQKSLAGFLASYVTALWHIALKRFGVQLYQMNIFGAFFVHWKYSQQYIRI